MTKKKLDMPQPHTFSDLTHKNRALAFAIVRNPNIAQYKLYKHYYPDVTDESAQASMSRLAKDEEFQAYIDVAKFQTEWTMQLNHDMGIFFDIMTDPQGNYAVNARAYLLMRAMEMTDPKAKTKELVKLRHGEDEEMEEVDRPYSPQERLGAIKTAHTIITPPSLDLTVSSERVTVIRKDVSPDVIEEGSDEWEV